MEGWFNRFYSYLVAEVLTLFAKRFKPIFCPTSANSVLRCWSDEFQMSFQQFKLFLHLLCCHHPPQTGLVEGGVFVGILATPSRSSSSTLSSLITGWVRKYILSSRPPPLPTLQRTNHDWVVEGFLDPAYHRRERPSLVNVSKIPRNIVSKKSSLFHGKHRLHLPLSVKTPPPVINLQYP